eukprot:g8956.t1
MPFRRPLRSADSLAVVEDSWLQEPSPVSGRVQDDTPFTNRPTSSRLVPVDEVLRRSETNKQGPFERVCASSITNRLPVSVSNPELHPGVGTLLNEYYKLLESTSSDAIAAVRSNRYQPSFFMKLWKLLTLKLPTPLRYGQSLRQIRTILKYTAPSSALGIIISLLLWLVVLNWLIKWPFVCLSVFVFGVCYLLIGEEKYKAKIVLEMEPKVQLEGFTVEKDSQLLPVLAKEYVRIKNHRRLIGGTNLNAIDWPKHLSKPDNCIKNEIKEIQKLIQKLRSVVIGPENHKTSNLDTEMSFESAVNSVQELCTLVGLDQQICSVNTQDWDSIRNELQLLQDELGL